MTYCLYRRLDWIFQKKNCSSASYVCITFSLPWRQLLLSDYTLMLSSQTKWYHLYKKYISFTNGIFDMQTSLAIPFTIFKTMNHVYLIFNTAIT